jgi:hypothetical protein
MLGHISRVLKGKSAVIVVGKNITNELTESMAERVHSKTISCAQNAKYFSIIADCTPDISHMERL